MRTGLVLIVVAAAALATHPGAASAAELGVIGSGEIVEAGYQLDIDVRGLVATVQARQTLLNPGAADVEAVYTFDLPAEAVITGLTVARAGGAAETGVVVTPGAAITLAADLDTIAEVPDLGLLRLLSVGERATGDRRGEPSTYELRVFPVSAGRTTVATVRWVMPLAIDGGRALLRLPSRGPGQNLSRETGRLRFRPVPGLRGYLDVHADGRRLAARAGTAALAFASSRSGDLRIEAGLDATATAAWVDVLPVDGQRGVIAVSALAPRALKADPLADRRILVVVDTSRSVGTTGLAAAARAVDAVLAAAPPSARIEAILFDRAPRRLFKTWRPAPEARGDLVSTIRGATPGNGTDLGAALALAAQALGEGSGDALVVLVSDGVVAAELDGDALRDRLGSAAAAVDVGAILLVPDDAALPDVHYGALAGLIRHVGGRAVALRVSELDRRAAALPAELREPEPLEDLGVEADGATVDITLPDALASGGGLVALGTYRGGRPGAARLTARRGEERVIVRARPAADASSTLALADADPIAFRGARRRAAVVAPDASLVALDRKARVTRQRLALVAAGGPFTRIPPPPELERGHRFEPFTTRPIELRSQRAAGSLPPDVVRSMLTQQLVPRARGCLARALAGGRRVQGTLTVELQLTRGEMMAAAAPGPLDPALVTCVVDAAYDLTVPAYATGGEPDPIYLVRYPLRFETRGNEAITILGDADSAEPIDTGVKVDIDDPMGNLRSKPR